MTSIASNKKRKMILLNKRGISPLIATILLIAIAIAIFGIIFMWLRGMISEQVEKFGVPIESQCERIAFTATTDGNKIFVNNQGNIPILGMNIKIKTDGKTLSKSIRKPIDGVISPGETDVIELESSFPFANATKKTITPVIEGKGLKSGSLVRYVCKTKALELQ
jgi:flagellin-like protein